MVDYEVAEYDFAEELVSFWRESFLAAYQDLHSRENIEAYFKVSYTLEEAKRILSDSNFHCLKAKKEDKTVGIATINHRKCPPSTDLKTSELKQLYLLPSEYGSGLAQEMMAKVFEVVKDYGMEYIWLSVSKLNPRAQRFYEKLGFEYLGDGEDIHVGNEILPSLILIRRL